MAKTLQAFLGQYTTDQPNINAADDNVHDFFFKVRSHNEGQYCAAIRTDALCPELYFKYKWEVPVGTSRATFHLWGGGGMGAGSNLCSQGLGGGSGAYAYKAVDVTPGDVYTLCFNGVERHCCTRTFCADGTTVLTDQGLGFVSRGTRGMKTYVTGTGLDNLCAEGGNPGAAVCCGWASSTYGQGYHTANTCFACVTVRMDCMLGRSTTDSDNDVFAPAKYYGADGGSKGIYACHQTSCCGTSSGIDASRCGDKEFVPYPGGLFKLPVMGHIEKPSVNGGLVAIKWCNTIGGVHNYFQCMMVGSGIIATGAPNQQAVGQGGFTPATCGGTCCCGSRGGPGMIRISYS